MQLQLPGLSLLEFWVHTVLQVYAVPVYVAVQPILVKVTAGADHEALVLCPLSKHSICTL